MPATISDQLRAAVADSGLSAFDVAKRAGLNRSTLSRFLAGEGLTLASVDQLARALGLQLGAAVGRRSPAKPRGRGRAKSARPGELFPDRRTTLDDLNEQYGDVEDVTTRLARENIPALAEPTD